MSKIDDEAPIGSIAPHGTEIRVSTSDGDVWIDMDSGGSANMSPEFARALAAMLLAGARRIEDAQLVKSGGL